MNVKSAKDVYIKIEISKLLLHTTELFVFINKRKYHILILLQHLQYFKLRTAKFDLLMLWN